MNFKKPGMLSKLGSGDLVSINLSTNNLRIVHATMAMSGKIKVSNLTGRNTHRLSDEDISDLIKKYFNETKIKTPAVISVIPSHLCITKNIEIPSIDPEEIAGIIDLQASRHTPYLREDIIISYIKIGIYKGNHTRILLVVVNRDKIRRQFDILGRAGLRIEKVLFGPEMVSRVCLEISRSGSQRPLKGIIHIDETFTDLIIALRGIPIFIRNIHIGAQHLVSEQGDYEIKFVEEVRKSLEVYEAEKVEENPNIFTFTGAVGDMRDLQAALGDTLHIPTEIIPYSEYLPISDIASKAAIADKNLSFLNNIASLLAYQKAEVDLIPEEIKSRRSFERRTGDIIKTGILIIIIFFLVTGILFSKISFKNAYLEKLISKYQPIIKEAKTMEKNFKKVTMVKNYLSGGGYSLEILIELYNFMPDALRLNNIKFDQSGSFSIKGVSKSRATVFTFVENMKESKYFQNVKIKRTTKREEKNGKVVDFEITCILGKR